MRKIIKTPSKRDEEISTQDKLLDLMMINAIMIESNDLKQTYYDIINKKELKAKIQIMHKQKNRKINSINVSLQDEINLRENIMKKMIENESIEREMHDDEKKVPRES